MRTAVDTNIISALWSGEPTSDGIAKQLLEAKQQGAVIVSGPVYAELLAYPNATDKFVNGFIKDTGMTLDFTLESAVWILAGQRFANYSQRRRKEKGAGPRRLLADFIIGAHAMIQADRLLTLDTSRYKSDFPELTI